MVLKITDKNEHDFPIGTIVWDPSDLKQKVYIENEWICIAKIPFHHELKVWMPYFQCIEEGSKNFELRYNDRNYKVGDVLRLQEWNQYENEYTGRTINKQIVYILEGGKFGLEKGYVIMQLKDTEYGL